MPKDKKKKIESKVRPPDEGDRDRVDVEADDEDETKGHISQADVWLRETSKNNWKRRR